MSADNWTICPECVKRAKDLKEAFIKKYYGKLDSFLYNQAIAEIDQAVDHVNAGGSDKFKPNKKILDLLIENNVKVELYGSIYGANEILQDGSESCTLREHYEHGVNIDDCSCYMMYGCSCDCGFEKGFIFQESKHKIVNLDIVTRQKEVK